MVAIRDSSGKIIRIAVSFPSVQFERVPWYENSQTILSILMGSLVVLAAVVVASLLRWGADFSFEEACALSSSLGACGSRWVKLFRRDVAWS